MLPSRRFAAVLLLFVLPLFLLPAALAEEEIIPPQWPVPDYVNRLLEVASEEVGYTEEEHGRTKYGEWAGDPYCQWCAEFQCWCVDQVDQRYGTSLLKNVYPLYSGSNEGRAWFIQAGRYVIRKGEVEGWGYEWLKGETSFISSGDYIPQPGDWVFFTWTSDDDTDHVAMVEYCTRDTDTGEILIHVIEGNAPSSVARNTYELNYGRILGYGTVFDLADLVIKGGCEGKKVTRLQQMLADVGLLDPAYVTGTYGNHTAEAIRSFQKSQGIEQTGVAGQQTQLALQHYTERYREDHPEYWEVEEDDAPFTFGKGE